MLSTGSVVKPCFEITVPFRDYFYETLGLKSMLATALSHNQPIIHYLLRTGWNLDKKIERHVKSNIDGTMLDLCFFSQSREAWRAWKAANLPDRNAIAKGDLAVGQGPPDQKR